METSKEILKKKVNRAFALMRKAGLMARQNFLCCNNCAGCQMTSDAVELVKKGRDVKGCAYYHGQEAERLYEFMSNRQRLSMDLYIQYGPMHSTENGIIGLDAKEVGRIVIRSLLDAGLPFCWNGDPDECIVIPLRSEIQRSWNDVAVPVRHLPA